MLGPQPARPTITGSLMVGQWTQALTGHIPPTAGGAPADSPCCDLAQSWACRLGPPGPLAALHSGCPPGGQQAGLPESQSQSSSPWGAPSRRLSALALRLWSRTVHVYSRSGCGDDQLIFY